MSTLAATDDCTRKVEMETKSKRMRRGVGAGRGWQQITAQGVKRRKCCIRGIHRAAQKSKAKRSGAERRKAEERRGEERKGKGRGLGLGASERGQEKLQGNDAGGKRKDMSTVFTGGLTDICLFVLVDLKAAVSLTE